MLKGIHLAFSGRLCTVYGLALRISSSIEASYVFITGYLRFVNVTRDAIFIAFQGIPVIERWIPIPKGPIQGIG